MSAIAKRTTRAGEPSLPSGRVARNVRTSAQRHEKSVGSLGDEAYERIKWKIVSAELPPGSFVNMQELSDELGLGRTPVLQAVHRLQHDGLMEVIQRKGIWVRAWSPRDINHLVEARIPLELAMIRLVVERASDGQLKALRELLTRGRALLSQNDRAGLMKLDQDFHDGLAACAGNPVIAQLLQNLHQRSAPLWAASHYGRLDAAKIHAQHEQILGLVAQRNEAEAATAMREHLSELITP
ncbi:MAG TPA: GntR family transcriptional regulator [Burkholderiaceae bacterium]|nr:GntR family transcriptional regulator [Burkholderiaceae bacterium]